jgi:23S rRNA (uridine2552-2'-O)-methyltransferase
VAARVVGPSGRVVGVDLAPIEPPLALANAFAIVGDLSNPSISREILARLGGPADVLLCDAAPKLTGVRATDRAREEALLEAVEARLPEILRPGGSAALKLLDGPEAERLRARLAGRFAQAKLLRPKATRKGSSERYLVLRGLRAGPVSPG